MEEMFEVGFPGDLDLDLEEDEDLLEAPEDLEDLEDFLLLGGGGDIDDLRGPLANSASAALSAVPESLFSLVFFSAGS